MNIGERPLKAAIVGTGKIAPVHVDALRAVAGMEVAAVFDVDLDRAGSFSAAHGVPFVYPSLDTLLESESPDLVVVCTPPATHSAIAISCLEAGVSVLCEKPLCGSLAEVDRIQEAERSGGAYCATVAHLRFGAAAQHVRRLIASGELGDPLLAVCHTLWHRDDMYYSVPWRGRWNTELGGVTLNLGIHEIDLLLWLLGDWHEVNAMATTLARHIEVDDVSLATVHFESGAVASVVNSVLSPREESYIRIDFERATVELRHLYGYANEDLRITTLAGAEVSSDWQSIPGTHRGEIAAQVREVVACIRQGAPLPLTTGEARTTIEFLSSLYKSASAHEPIRRGTVGPQDPFYLRVAGTLGSTV